MACNTHKNRLSNLFPAPLAEVDTLFNHFFGPGSGSAALSRWHAPASLWEAEDRLHVEIDAPGVAKDDVDVTLDKGVLSIAIKRDRDEERKYWHNERGFGKVVRTVTLPDTVDPDSIEAKLTDGVLRVSIAKRPEAQPRKVELK